MAIQLSVGRLIALLEARNDDGTPRYRPEDVLHFLPLVLLLAAPEQVGKLPPNLDKVMRDFAGKLGLSGPATPEAIQKAMVAYYAKNPVNPELAQDFRDVVQLTAEQTLDKLDAAKAAKVLHEQHTVIPQRGDLWGGGDDAKKK